MGFGAAAAADAAVGLTNTIVSGVSAKRTRDEYWQKSGMAHRIEVNDLEKAGLNPVLSAGGAGAPVGMGPTAESNLKSDFLGAYQAKSKLALESRVADANMGLIKAQTAASTAQALKTKAEEDQIRLSILNNPLTLEQLRESINETKARSEGIGYDNRKKKALAPAWDTAGEGINTVIQMYPALIDFIARKLVEAKRSEVQLYGGKRGSIFLNPIEQKMLDNIQKGFNDK